MTVFSLYHQLDTLYIENKFFHIFNIDFIVDERLEAFIMNINSDPSFRLNKTIFDAPKQRMIEDILKNTCLKVIKNMPTKKFKDLKIKENNKQIFKRITQDSGKLPVDKRFQRALKRTVTEKSPVNFDLEFSRMLLNLL